MNLFHRRFCRSSLWKHIVKFYVLPWTLDGLELGASVLELGPGYGASTDLLRSKCKHLTCVESDRQLARYLHERMPAANTTVLWGDASAMQLPDAEFDGAVCFMMLHHVTTSAQQDRLFAETARVLQPGGVFAGSDSVAGPVLRVLHLFDTVTMIEPMGLPDRLKAAGFENVQVDVGRHAFRFRARKSLSKPPFSTT